MTDTESELRKQVRLLQEENRLLRERMDLLIKRMWGSKSEKIDPSQLLLGIESESGEPEASPPEKEVGAAVSPNRTSRPRRQRIPEHLPVEEQIIEPLEVKAHPSAWRKIDEEVTQLLDYTPGRFFCRRIVRPVYVSAHDPDRAPIRAPLPPRMVEKGGYGAGLMSEIVTAKYADHLPLDRQEKIYKTRYGVHIPKQSMSRIIDQVADGCQLVVKEMIRQQFASKTVQIDETPIRHLAPGEGKCRTGYLWATHVPGGDSVFHWGPGRSLTCLEAIVPPAFEGTLQTDGYSVYPALQKRRSQNIRLAGCWAHARRPLKEAYESGAHPAVCAWLLRQIQLLYEIESRLRTTRAGPELRAAVRESESLPIYHRILKATRLLYGRSRITPSSALGKALAYLLNHAKALEEPFHNGVLEIDNNLVENAIRPTAVGKKNWLFIGDRGAGRKAAILYTLICSCRNHGVEPREYIEHLIETLPLMTNQQVNTVTPAAYASKRLRRVS